MKNDIKNNVYHNYERIRKIIIKHKRYKMNEPKYLYMETGTETEIDTNACRVVNP